MGKKNVIWSSFIDLESWKDYLEEEFPFVTDESEKYRLCAELNSAYLDDEKANLSGIAYSNPIICIADVGRWNGRFKSYQIIGNMNGALLNEIFSFSEGDDQEFYVQDGEVRCDDYHHDSTNHYIYRALKCSMDEAEPLFDHIYDQKELTKELLDQYTVSIAGDVAKVYGWDIAAA